jgi:hypothetical protein
MSIESDYKELMDNELISGLISRHHGDGIHGARVHADAAPIALFPVDLERFLYRAGAETTYAGADAAVDAHGRVGPLNERPLIAGLLQPQKVAAAVVAAEADPLYAFAALVPERPRYQVFFPSFLKNGINLVPGCHVSIRAGRKLQADVRAGALAGAAVLPAITIRYPELIMLIHYVFRLIQRANKVESEVVHAHKYTLPLQDFSFNNNTLAACLLK